jgi:hypothetical protein
MDVSGQAHTLLTSLPEKEPTFIKLEPGWAMEVVWMLWKRIKALSAAKI